MARTIPALLLVLEACSSTAGPVSADRTTCAEWLERMDADQRVSMARAVLIDLWRSSGAREAPGPDAVAAFADGIGSVCRGDATTTVSSIGLRVYESLPDVQPASTAEAPSADASGHAASEPDEAITISIDGRDRAEVVVADVELIDSYVGADGTELSGVDQIFVQLFVRYRSLTDGLAYGPNDWLPVVDGIPRHEALAVLRYGPDPPLSPGVLDEGEEAGGYLVFELPVRGEVLLSYTKVGEADPAVQVTLRDAPRQY